MSKKIFAFVILFLIVILQVSFLPNFFPTQAAPDLILIILIFLAARRGFGEVWKMAIVAGLIMDIFSSYPIGVNIVSYTFVMLVTSYLAKRFLVTPTTVRFFILLFLVVIGTVANDFVVAALMRTFTILNHIESGKLLLFSRELGYKIISNFVIFLIIYWPLRKYEKLKNFYGQRAILQNNVR